MPSETPNRESIPSLWWAILAAYLVLFVVTTWTAFFAADKNPILDKEFTANLPTSEDSELKTAILETIKEEAAEHSKKRSLATTSFNVVLGALLGFLSGSAASRLAPPSRSREPVTESSSSGSA